MEDAITLLIKSIHLPKIKLEIAFLAILMFW